MKQAWLIRKFFQRSQEKMFAEKSVSQSMKLFPSSLVSAAAVAIDFRRVIVMMENCYRNGKEGKCVTKQVVM
jgi:hypothetical protein